MKRIMIFYFSLIPIFLIGQTAKNEKFEFGAGFGVSMNNVFNHISNAEFESRLSPILITVNIERRLSRKWSMFSELDYVHKGPEAHDINYLVFSVLPKYDLLSKPNISLIAGPYIGYMFKYESYGRERNHEELKNYDAGIDAGLMYHTRITNNLYIFVSPRIEAGMIRFSYSNHLSYQLKTGVKF